MLNRTAEVSGLVSGVITGVRFGVMIGLRLGVEALGDPTGVRSLSKKVLEMLMSVVACFSSPLSFSIPYQLGALVGLPPLVMPLF